jgi:hypothetical protein
MRRFYEMVNSAHDTATGEIEVVARVDDDSAYPPDDRVTFVRGPRPLVDGYVRMSGLWNEAWQHATGDIAMLCGDDVIFHTKGWDAKVEKAFDKFPDRIGMVYCHAGMEERPVLPFVSREWTDVAGFVPKDLQGWFSDEWLWSIAAEIGRVIYLDAVLIKHEQAIHGMDQTYFDGMRAREHVGGLNTMREVFYSVPEVRRRDVLVEKLKAKTSSYRVSPPGPPDWMKLSLRLAAEARKLYSLQTDQLLVTVHCYSGDKQNVKDFMPLFKHHDAPVLVLSPADAQVKLRGVECRSVGGRGYFGQVSLDRQRAHLEQLLEYPQNYFLLNDADSICVSPAVPGYLFEGAAQGIVYSNEVPEWRPHRSPYPKIGMHPPYFLSRGSIERMLSVADRPEVRAHPITPFIDWYMLALCEEARVEHENYTNGFSCPAWGFDYIPGTVEQGHDAKHEHNPAGRMRGDLLMIDAVKLGAVMLHSIKHREVMDRVVAAHQEYLRRGSPQPNTLTIEEYAQGLGVVTVQEGSSGMGEGESVRV